MKKYLLSLLAFVIGVNMAIAGPIDNQLAQSFGEKFVQANFDLQRQGSDLILVHTATSERGSNLYYIYNVGNEGFVIVSAVDSYHPIIGYSDEGTLDVNNLSPELAYHLSTIENKIKVVMDGQATPDIVDEWNSVRDFGKVIPGNRTRGVDHLCQTKWNQDYPYNYYCPTAPSGPGGHVYAGCVATAMSQVMKYWDHPTKGNGTHTHIGQTINFGATTYDWANMPNAIHSGSPQAQIDAIATLMFHCGMAVDMGYGANGSGAYSYNVPDAIASHFFYAPNAVLRNRDSYQLEVWQNMLKESFDMGWPLYYSGCTSGTGPNDGCHAFVCDGYDDNDLFYFNWGWSGSGDGYFTVDGMEYARSSAAIFNFVPAEVYANTPKEPTSLTVTPTSETALSAEISWTNPSKTLSNGTLSAIDKIVITRDGQQIASIENPAPGAAMTYQDNSVPCYTSYNYAVYAVCNNNRGKSTTAEKIKFGPCCDWKIIMTTTSFQGWRGGKIKVYDAAAKMVAEATTTNSSPASANIAMPLGKLSFAWKAPEATIDNMTFMIKDVDNNTVYSFSGSSSELASGVFFATNNSCGNTGSCAAPANLHATTDPNNGNNIIVSWEGPANVGYGYNVYRNERLYRLIPSGTSFVDENVTMGGYCYQIAALCESGESEPSLVSCTTAGEGCNPPKNLDYEKTGSLFKTKLKWEKPEPSDGLSGYFIYRKAEGGEYERIKLVGASSTSYTDNSNLTEGSYYYKIYAYYQATDCTTAPANWIYDPNQFYLHVYYSPTGVEENTDEVRLFPNPAHDNFTIEAKGLQRIMVYNMLGQLALTVDCDSDNTVIKTSNLESGIYMVNIRTNDGESVRRISVIR